MRTYNVASAATRQTLGRSLPLDTAAEWMATTSPLSPDDARGVLAVALAGETVRCGALLIDVHDAPMDGAYGVAALRGVE